MDPRQVLLSALPPLLLGLGVVLNSVLISVPSSSARWYTVPTWRLVASIGVGLLSAATLFVGGLIALLRGLPDCGYTWAGAGFATLALGLNLVAGERAELGLPLISPAVDIVILVLLLLAGLVLLGWTALRGWPQAGLVSIGISTVMVLSLCGMATNAPFYRYDLALAAGPLGLLTALLIYIYVRRPGIVRIAAMVGIGLSSIATTVMVNQAWRTWLATRGQPSPLLPFLILLTGSLLAGPVLGVSAQFLRRAVKRG
ncbi:MAG: hypothetical protein PVI59_03855 [Anaerolineae bacterium]